MEETLSEDAVAVAPRVDEEQRVAGWRLHVLLEAGYPEPLAASLAASKADLHQAVRLVAQSCPADLAAAILL